MNTDRTAKHPKNILRELSREQTLLSLLKGSEISQKATPSASCVKERSVSCLAAARVLQSTSVNLVGNLDQILKSSCSALACGDTLPSLFKAANHLQSFFRFQALHLFIGECSCDFAACSEARRSTEFLCKCNHVFQCVSDSPLSFSDVNGRKRRVLIIQFSHVLPRLTIRASIDAVWKPIPGFQLQGPTEGFLLHCL